MEDDSEEFDQEVMEENTDKFIHRLKESFLKPLKKEIFVHILSSLQDLHRQVTGLQSSVNLLSESQGSPYESKPTARPS